MRINSILVLIILFAFSDLLYAQDTEMLTVWRDALAFGIDQQVITTIRTLEESKNTELAPKVLLRIQESKNPQLFEVAFKYFATIEFTGGTDFATALVQNPVDTDTASLRKILLYLADYADSIEDIAEELIAQLENTDINNYVAITLGRRANTTIIDKLIDVYENEDTTRNTQMVVLSSLAEAKNAHAIQFLKDVIDNNASDDDILQLALIALAASPEIDSQSTTFESIEAFLNSSNDLTKRSAYSVLKKIKHEQSEYYFKQGIRDDNWRVRLQALEGIQTQAIQSLEAAVLFVLKQDPVIQVRSKAIEVAMSFSSPIAHAVFLELLLKGSPIRAQLAVALIETGTDTLLADVIEYILLLPYTSGELNYVAAALPNILRPGLERICTYFLDSNSYPLQLAAIRTITTNTYSGFIERITPFTAEDKPLLLQHEATQALEKISAENL